MPPDLPLPDLQRQLRNLLLENPADALKALLELLPAGSEKAGTAGALLGALNDTNKQSLRGTLSNDDLQRAYNRIRAATLDLIDGLAASDFDPAAHGPEAPKNKRGEILYRIPDTMPLRRETRCLVRIALDEASIVEDIILDEHVTLKPLSRVSDLMQVELIDPSSEGVFRLRAINTPEQIVEESGYTEWLFYVTPQREGTFPLLIRVAVIELLMGRERKKEIVLEEEVRILSEIQPGVAEQPLKAAGEKLLFQSAAGGILPNFDKKLSDILNEGDNEEPFYDPSNPPVYPWTDTLDIPAQNRFGWKQLTAVFIGILLLGTTATWAIAPQEMAWAWTRYVTDSPGAYAVYAEKYPESRHRETAVYRKAELLQTVAAFREYRESYPGGKFSTRVTNTLEKMETRDFEAVTKAPDTRKVRRFLDDFPQSARLDSIQTIVLHSDTLREALEPIVREKIEARSKWLEKNVPQDTVGSKPGDGGGLPLLNQRKTEKRHRKDSVPVGKKRQ